MSLLWNLVYQGNINLRCDHLARHLAESCNFLAKHIIKRAKILQDSTRWGGMIAHLGYWSWNHAIFRYDFIRVNKKPEIHVWNVRENREMVSTKTFVRQNCESEKQFTEVSALNRRNWFKVRILDFVQSLDGDLPLRAYYKSCLLKLSTLFQRMYCFFF